MKKLLCLGDSITYGDEGGYRVHLGALLRSVRADFAFVGSLESQWGPHEGYPGFSIEDLTNGRDGGQYGVSRKIESTLALFQPDALLLMAGTNDLYEADPWDSFLRLTTLVERASCQLPEMTILVASLLPIAPGPKPWNATVPEDVVTRVPEFNGCIRGYVEAGRVAGRRLHFVDAYRTIATPMELAEDGVHPILPVFRKLASVWFAGLKKAGVF